MAGGRGGMPSQETEPLNDPSDESQDTATAALLNAGALGGAGRRTSWNPLTSLSTAISTLLRGEGGSPTKGGPRIGPESIDQSVTHDTSLVSDSTMNSAARTRRSMPAERQDPMDIPDSPPKEDVPRAALSSPRSTSNSRDVKPRRKTWPLVVKKPTKADVAEEAAPSQVTDAPSPKSKPRASRRSKPVTMEPALAAEPRTTRSGTRVAQNTSSAVVQLGPAKKLPRVSKSMRANAKTDASISSEPPKRAAPDTPDSDESVFYVEDVESPRPSKRSRTSIQAKEQLPAHHKDRRRKPSAKRQKQMDEEEAKKEAAKRPLTGEEIAVQEENARIEKRQLAEKYRAEREQKEETRRAEEERRKAEEEVAKQRELERRARQTERSRIKQLEKEDQERKEEEDWQKRNRDNSRLIVKTLNETNARLGLRLVTPPPDSDGETGGGGGEDDVWDLDDGRHGRKDGGYRRPVDNTRVERLSMFGSNNSHPKRQESKWTQEEMRILAEGLYKDTGMSCNVD
jgi:hypothetical protein